MSSHGSPMKTGQVIGMMARWSGTGRYTQKHQVPGAHRVSLGSPASMHKIIENLGMAGLLDGHQESEQEPALWQISERGLALIDRLHPDCEDPDLPFRLDAWAAAGYASMPAIDRYVRTFFGKQLRFSPSRAA